VLSGAFVDVACLIAGAGGAGGGSLFFLTAPAGVGGVPLFFLASTGAGLDEALFFRVSAAGVLFAGG
jgi:hypothetical protein